MQGGQDSLIRAAQTVFISNVSSGFEAEGLATKHAILLAKQLNPETELFLSSLKQIAQELLNLIGLDMHH